MTPFCGTKFWDWDLSWNTESVPDFTLCFEDTILICMPCIIFWILSIWETLRIISNHHNHKAGHPWTVVSISRIFLALILLIVSLLELLYRLFLYSIHDINVSTVDFITSGVKTITFSYFIALIEFHRKNGIHSSASISLFWSLLVLGMSVNFKTVLNIVFTDNVNDMIGGIDELVFSAKALSYPIAVIQLLLTYSSHSSHTYLHSKEKSCPQRYASYLSRITFSWFTPMIIKGYRHPLTTEDMWALDRDNISDNILKKFNRIWLPLMRRKTRIGSKTRVTLFGPLIKTFSFDMTIVAIIKLMASLLVFVNPLLLDRLISYMTPTNTEPEWRGYLYACLMFISPLFESLLNSQYEYRINMVCMRMRACIISTIYNKSIKLSSFGRQKFTTGEIVNLMSVDSQRIIEFFLMANVVWSAPFQIVIASFLIWQQLGASTLAGLAFMLVLIPFNGYMTTKVRNYQLVMMRVKDIRVKLMNEILNGIKVLKLYAWETSFRDQVLDNREKEVHALKLGAIYQGAIVFTFVSAPFFVGLFSFATFVLISSDNVLDANKAFVSLSLFNLMRVPLGYLPILLSSGALCLVSLQRINEYLNAEEIDENAVNRDVTTNPVVIKHASFSWSKDDIPVLRDISIDIKENKLIAVVGRVGAGKSSLLSAILGEMEKIMGTVSRNGTVAYVPQQAWIQNETLRENILFNNGYNERHYHRVLESCALTEDLKVLQAGDLTEIGEKGINLSGGQKQRVSLARAVYSNADIYLLDDPLRYRRNDMCIKYNIFLDSAVDAHVGRHLFEKTIGGNGILKDKTRILVTHRVSFLPFVDEIIVLKDGAVSESGTFEQLISNKSDFADFITEYLLEVSDNDFENGEIDVMKKLREQLKPMIDKSIDRSISSSAVSEPTGDGMRKRKTFIRSGSALMDDKTANSDLKNDKSIERTDGKLIESETSKTGSVKLDVYVQYIHLIGLTFSAFIIISFVLSNVAQVLSGLWLSQWSEDSLDANRTGDNDLRDLRLGVYTGIGVFDTVFNLIANISVSLGCIRAAKLLHNSMMIRIIRAPMAFFDTTPIGRILNRFSRDVDTTDVSLVFNFRMTILQFFRTVVAFTIVSLETPVILAFILPLTVMYCVIQKIYISSSRQLKRIDSTSRSPIYNHFSETVNGVTSIRAYGVCDQFIDESNRRVDANHMCYYPSFTASRWLAIRIEFLGNCIVFLAALFAVLSRHTLSPGIAGLAISYALNITGFLALFVRCATDLETNIVSVERCLEYTETPIENEWYNEITRPKKEWPERGSVVFNEYSTRYREGLDLVLKNITLEIKPKEKVGVVGRTGAGKSSLTLALFRLIEPTDGTIFIDDVDIRRLGLYDLRSRLTVIPQDPALFTGSLRLNLDPFGQHSDTELWRALESAHLKTFVESLDKGLSYQISEGGENLSVGQKQLVCLARALLRRTKILVLDEATAAVDMETDDLIQETIRQSFSSSTIVTIAHRLNTIIDYDRILVMDKGLVKEFDSPNNLLSNHNSMFYSMAKEANLVTDSDS